MRRAPSGVHATIVMLAVLLPCAGTVAGEAQDPPSPAAAADPHGAASAEALVELIRMAARAKDKAGFIRAVDRETVPAHVMQRIEATRPRFMDEEVESIVAEARPAESAATIPGFRYNVGYRGVIILRYRGPQAPVEMPFGERAGRFYLATMVRSDR